MQIIHLQKKVKDLIVTTVCYYLILILTLFTLFSCAGNNKLVKVESALDNEMAYVKSWISPNWPRSQKVRKTTNSHIYLANINASISSLESRVKKQASAENLKQLAKRLYFRFKILGDFEDAKRALTLINQAVELDKNNASLYLTLSNISTGFHHFDEAKQALDKYAEIKSKDETYKKLLQEIYFAQGNYKEVNFRELQGNEIILGKRALLNGQFQLASYYNKIAETKYQGIDPYVLSWIQLQQGIALLRYGEYESAKVFFQTIHERFPEYFLATEHLAETQFLLGNYKQAKSLYQQVIKQTKNPEFTAMLAKVEKAMGNNKESRKLVKSAQEKFDYLVKNYPKALNDHAVGFYLDNSQYAKGLALAKSNLANRKNIESLLLYAQASLQAGETEKTCKAYHSIQLLNQQYHLNPIEWTELKTLIEKKC